MSVWFRPGGEPLSSEPTAQHANGDVQAIEENPLDVKPGLGKFSTFHDVPFQRKISIDDSSTPLG
jgi:hypothetical protein